MGRSARVARESGEKGRGSSTLWHEIEAIFAIAGACYLAVSFLTYVPHRSGANAGGPVGHLLADLFVQAFGLAAFLVPAFIAVVGARRSAHGAAAADRDDARASARPGA